MLMTEWATLLVALASGGADDAQVIIYGGAEGSDIPWWTRWALGFGDNVFEHRSLAQRRYGCLPLDGQQGVMVADVAKPSLLTLE